MKRDPELFEAVCRIVREGYWESPEVKATLIEREQKILYRHIRKEAWHFNAFKFMVVARSQRSEKADKLMHLTSNGRSSFCNLFSFDCGMLEHATYKNIAKATCPACKEDYRAKDLAKREKEHAEERIVKLEVMIQNARLSIEAYKELL